MDQTTETRLKKILKINPVLFVGLLLIVLTVLLFIPFLFIWSVNTLFGVGIAYSFINWIAATVILVLLNCNKS
jgi:hypothetical protein